MRSNYYSTTSKRTKYNIINTRRVIIVVAAPTNMPEAGSSSVVVPPASRHSRLITFCWRANMYWNGQQQLCGNNPTDCDLPHSSGRSKLNRYIFNFQINSGHWTRDRHMHAVVGVSSYWSVTVITAIKHPTMATLYNPSPIGIKTRITQWYNNDVASTYLQYVVDSLWDKFQKNSSKQIKAMTTAKQYIDPATRIHIPIWSVTLMNTNVIYPEQKEMSHKLECPNGLKASMREWVTYFNVTWSPHLSKTMSDDQLTNYPPCHFIEKLCNVMNQPG